MLTQALYMYGQNYKPRQTERVRHTKERDIITNYTYKRHSRLHQTRMKEDYKTHLLPKTRARGVPDNVRSKVTFSSGGCFSSVDLALGDFLVG